jgi:AhpD family alkylhydroperoxidase
MSTARVPLLELPEEVAVRLAELGGKPVNLYRALANQPAMLSAWIEFAWSVRQRPETPRRLRELMIVLGAQRLECDYEMAHHRKLAAAYGVSEEELAELPDWRGSAGFSAPERAALAFMEAMVEGSVPEPVATELARHFSAAERIELTLTAGFYCMVPRVLDALQVPLETDGTASPEG